jgi:anti-sigma factor RsiW
MSSPTIREADLHAYVDGQLDAERRAEVEAYLAEHPEAVAQVQHVREQIQALHREYDDVLNEPIPLRLAQASHWRAWPRGLAAGIAWLACGAAAGWFAHAAMQPQYVASTAFARDALAAHVLYVSEKRHPVEVPAEQESHLVAWLSNRLDAPIRAPDLQGQGFSLLGGRLLPSGDAPLAQLMYESKSGERLTLTVKHAAQHTEQTGFEVMERNGTSVFYWID